MVLTGGVCMAYTICALTITRGAAVGSDIITMKHIRCIVPVALQKSTSYGASKSKLSDRLNQAGSRLDDAV